MKTLVVHFDLDFKFSLVSSCLVHKTRIFQQAFFFFEMALELVVVNIPHTNCPWQAIFFSWCIIGKWLLAKLTTFVLRMVKVVKIDGFGL
jgi:hypothetical protein